MWCVVIVQHDTDEIKKGGKIETRICSRSVPIIYPYNSTYTDIQCYTGDQRRNDFDDDCGAAIIRLRLCITCISSFIRVPLPRQKMSLCLWDASARKSCPLTALGGHALRTVGNIGTSYIAILHTRLRAILGEIMLLLLLLLPLPLPVG